MKYKTQENSCEWVGVTKGLWFEKLSHKNYFWIIHFKTLNTRERVAKEQWWPKVCSVKFSITIIRVFCIMYNEIGNLRERVRRGCAWHKVYDVKILITKIWIFHIVNVQILKTRERESAERVGLA